MIRQLVGSDRDAREGLGRDRRQVVHAEPAQDKQDHQHDLPLLDVNRGRGPLRTSPSGLLPQLFSESRGVRMARMGVSEMPEEVLRLHGDIADGTMIRLRQCVTFRLSNGRMERGLLFRSDAIGPRTHAYIAPDASVERIGLSPSTLSTARPKSPIVTTSRSSRSPDVAISRRFAPTESSSSMNTMDGDFSRASWNSSRTSRAPSPIYFWTSSDPTNRMNVAWVRLATALARRVFPVPGGPTKRTPFGGSIPTLRYSSGFRSGSSTA